MTANTIGSTAQKVRDDMVAEGAADAAMEQLRGQCPDQLKAAMAATILGLAACKMAARALDVSNRPHEVAPRFLTDFLMGIHADAHVQFAAHLKAKGTPQ